MIIERNFLEKIPKKKKKMTIFEVSKNHKLNFKFV